MQPAYLYADGTGFGHPWELRPYGNYTMLTKDGAINGYNSELQFSVSIIAVINDLTTKFSLYNNGSFQANVKVTVQILT